MTRPDHRRQILVFLLAVCVPYVVLLVMSVRGVRQESDLREKRRLDARAAAAREQLTERLETIRKEETHLEGKPAGWANIQTIRLSAWRGADRDTEFAVKTMLDAMSDALARGHRIEIRGFGSFALNYRPPRTGRNPKSGEKVSVPSKWVPHFKAGKELRERVDQSI